MDCVDETRAIYVDKGAWHSKGKVVSQEEVQASGDSSLFMRENGRMNYDVVLQPAFQQVPSGNSFENKIVPGQYHVIRTDDFQVLSPSTVTQKYGTLSPSDIDEHMFPLISEGFMIHAAKFVLYNGQSEVNIYRMNTDENLEGEIKPYAIIQNFHGGKGSCRGFASGFRPDCANMIAAAISQNGIDFRVRHNRNVKTSLDEAMQDWSSLQDSLKAFSEKANTLRSFSCDIPETVDEILDIPQIMSKKGKISKQLERKKEDLITRANNPRVGTYGQNAWDIYNAVTNWTTHSNSGKGAQSADERFAGILNGTRGNFERAAFDKLYGMATA